MSMRCFACGHRIIDHPGIGRCPAPATRVSEPARARPHERGLIVNPGNPRENVGHIANAGGRLTLCGRPVRSEPRPEPNPLCVVCERYREARNRVA